MEDALQDGLQEALRRWQAVAFSGLQKDLDKQGLEILENQQESIATRKQLADLTRDYKKTPEEEKAAALKALLKAYQGEIDRLTKRSKFAESAFLDAYKKLADVPDPAPMLAAAFEESHKLPQVEVLRMENKRLRDELDEATREFVDLKNQAVTVTWLKDKLADYESKMDKLVKQKTAEREAALKEEFDGKVKAYKEREFDLERQLSRYKDQVASLQTNHDTSQATMLSHSMRFDEAVSAKLAEMEIVMSDLERANERIAALERDKEAYERQLQGGRTTDYGQQLEALRKQYERQLALKENEVARALDAVAKLNQVSVTKQVTHASVVNELQARISDLSEEVAALQDKVQERADYDEIKRELAVLCSVEFSAADREGATLEAQLLQKSRRLQSELTAVKVSLDELQQRAQATEARERAAVLLAEERRLQVVRLEEDISTMYAAANAAASPHAHVNPHALPPAASLSLPLQGEARPGGVAGGAPAEPADTSLVAILSGQRDRYRRRGQELEEANKKLQQSIDELTAKVNALKEDNVKLYEKIRYLQDFREERLVKAPAVALDMSGDVTGRYKSAYEERMNPFNEFNEKERRRQYQSLNVAERATLNVSRFFLSNKHARTFVFFYTVLLHLLVLFVMYDLAMREACVHDHDVAEAVAGALVVNALREDGAGNDGTE